MFLFLFSQLSRRPARWPLGYRRVLLQRCKSFFYQSIPHLFPSRPRISYHPLNKPEVVSYLSAWLPDDSFRRVSWIVFISRSDCLVHHLDFRLAKNHRIDILKHR
jgi:hypothetical protein